MKTEQSKRVCRVTLLNVPTALYSESLRHLTELCHELRLVQLSREAADDAPDDGELGELIDALLDAHASSRAVLELEVLAALEQGRARTDLEIDVPEAAADDAATMLGLLEQADDLSRADRLLTLPAGGEIVALRRWTVEEITRQLRDGWSPEPCPL